MSAPDIGPEALRSAVESEAWNTALDRRVAIDYTNYRGERKVVVIVPQENGFVFRETPHHRPAQWVVNALTLKPQPDGRRAVTYRTYALCAIHAWRALTADEATREVAL